VHVSAHQAAYNHVDVRSVPSPEGPERSLIAIDRAADDERFVFHLQEIGHCWPTNGLHARRQREKGQTRKRSSKRTSCQTPPGKSNRVGPGAQPLEPPVTSVLLARRGIWTHFLSVQEHLRDAGRTAQ